MESYRHREYEKENPSFSSTLLDEIYRSMAEGDGHEEEKVAFYRETRRNTHSNHHRAAVKVPAGRNDLMVEDMATFRRACMVEKWMEKKVTQEVILRRKSAVVDFERRKRGNVSDSLFVKSSSSSSDSSCGGGFSSSEAESLCAVSSRSSNYTKRRPKPIRTSVSVLQPEKFYKHDQKENYGGSRHHHHHESDCMPKQKTKHDLGFSKTKSKALKIYGDLKKVKQPISPGGRLASFLNCLFTPGSSKKAKISSTPTTYEDKVPAERKPKSTHESTCSSASSFTRSCLSTTTPSRRKSSNGTKRSVRFYPVSVIVGEDYRPCVHKSLYEDDNRNIGNSINEQLKFQIMEKNRRVEEVARDLLNNYRHKVDVIRNAYKYNNDREFEEEDDGDSCASSDLFELDNLNVVGIDRYSEELPVYETTHLGTVKSKASF